jgi:tRNA A-37 threonylcarbamoyl transferase component Bud32
MQPRSTSLLLSNVEDKTQRLARFIEQWNSIRDKAILAQNFTEADLGISPTGKGLKRHANIALLLQVRDELRYLQSGLNELVMEGLNGHLSKQAQTTLGEVKYKFHTISLMIEEFEDQRFVNELACPTSINIKEENFVAADESIFEMDDVVAGEEKTLNSAADRLELYSIGNKLRNTLQGELFQGVVKSTGQQVAIKACRKDLINSKLSVSGNKVLENPETEVEVMATIVKAGGHPNLLNLVDSFETKDRLYIVLEFAGRGELFDIVSQAGRLDEEVVRVFFKQIVSGVQFLHSHGICHLDISLENILMDDEGTLKICDFGLSRVIEKYFFLGTSSKPGKTQYMSPEIYAGMEFSGEKSDVFSLGVVLFIMLAGFPPFDRPAVSDMRFSYIMNGHLQVLLKRWKLNTVISNSAVDLLNRIMCPPEKRIGIEELLRDPWLNM